MSRMHRTKSYNSIARTTSSGLATMGGTTNPTNDEVDEVELVLPGESLESGQGLELRLQGGDKRRISRLESIDDSEVLKEGPCIKEVPGGPYGLRGWMLGWQFQPCAVGHR